MKNLFEPSDLQFTIDRINKLMPQTEPNWGKMNVSQMLAHCCVAYEMAFENKHKKPNFFMRMMLKAFVKNAVVGPKPYPKNGRTAPVFIISDERDFEKEKKRLEGYLQKTNELGAQYFEGKESLSFGALTAQEWNMLFSKHLDHHLTQFGV